MLTNTLISVLGLAASASAHIIMSEPTGWKVDSSPLLPDGSNFPCKGVTYDSSVTANKMSKGAKQSMSFIGSAVHGGGSCQVSLTTDAKPTKDSVWKVIKSFEGGCPASDTQENYAEDPNMVLPTKYGFEIPEDVPAGKYTLAWTWFNKVGNREMYMNCAPIVADGEGGSESAFQDLPDMFVANIGNGCQTKEGLDLEFPVVGKLFERLGLPSSLGALSVDDLDNINKDCEALKAGGSGGSGGAAPSSGAPAKSPLDSIASPGGIFSPVDDSSSSEASAAPST
ncbi:hypothetical protein IMZ48_37945, partial [Candidatus Bathyarchaeota archaeon]|nr:hypothetical protein [Candidatus Bathyarchaeota archaeon]